MTNIKLSSEEILPSYLHGRKASEVFLEYATPILDILLEERDSPITVTELEKILRLPWCIWNKIVAESDPDNEFTELIQQQINNAYYYNMPPGAELLMQNLEERKKTKFKQYQYYLGKYKVCKKGNKELSIYVEHAPQIKI